jgi:lipopolysaccharide export system protein LptA
MKKNKEKSKISSINDTEYNADSNFHKIEFNSDFTHENGQSYKFEYDILNALIESIEKHMISSQDSVEVLVGESLINLIKESRKDLDSSFNFKKMNKQFIIASIKKKCSVKISNKEIQKGLITYMKYYLELMND